MIACMYTDRVGHSDERGTWANKDCIHGYKTLNNCMGSIKFYTYACSSIKVFDFTCILPCMAIKVYCAHVAVYTNSHYDMHGHACMGMHARMVACIL